MRCDELVKLGTQDVEHLDNNRYLVSIDASKNDEPRQFIIGDPFYDKVKQYIDLRPSDYFSEPRFFIQFLKGKCNHQVIGRNKIGETPKSIAKCLKLKNPEKYTGHCFRGTSSTLLAESGANESMLMQLGGWKSSKVAQSNLFIYILF